MTVLANAQRLMPGSRVLAQVVAVRELELIVSLPGQLLAHVPITSVSAELTARLQASHDDDSEDDDEESDDEDDAPSLSTLFHVGQFVCAVVVSVKDSNRGGGTSAGSKGDELSRAAGRVELSLEPHKVNAPLKPSDIVHGLVVQASVKSEEENGFVLSLGIADLSSFVSFKDAAKASAEDKLQVGQDVLCVIRKVAENGRTCTVTLDRAKVRDAKLASEAGVHALAPLQLVDALITARSPSGLSLKLFGLFDATIDRFHLAGKDPERDFTVGQRLVARVIWESLASEPKRVALSIAPHLVTLDTHLPTMLEQAFPVGKTVNSATIARVDEDWGLTCVCHDDQGTMFPAFVHISNVSDEHLSRIPSTGAFAPGTTHQARVVGSASFDGLVQLALKPSVLSRTFLRVADVKVGAKVSGTVRRLTPTALFVSIDGAVDAVVWPAHYSDVRLKQAEKRFTPGKTVKGRVRLAFASEVS